MLLTIFKLIMLILSECILCNLLFKINKDLRSLQKSIILQTLRRQFLNNY